MMDQPGLTSEADAQTLEQTAPDEAYMSVGIDQAEAHANDSGNQEVLVRAVEQAPAADIPAELSKLGNYIATIRSPHENTQTSRSGLLGRVLNQVWPQKTSRRDLVRKEATIGGQLFGEVPAGHARDFFCLDEHTWVWHEQWRDQKGKPFSLTTRYEIHPDRIIKIQDDQSNLVLGSDESNRLLEAAQWYYHLVSKQVYGLSA